MREKEMLMNQEGVLFEHSEMGFSLPNMPLVIPVLHVIPDLGCNNNNSINQISLKFSSISGDAAATSSGNNQSVETLTSSSSVKGQQQQQGVFTTYARDHIHQASHNNHISLQNSSANICWGETSSIVGDEVGMKMKMIKGRRKKMREPRFCFKTMSQVDVLDDGYKWRKYGQKVVKNTHHPRSYYRCTHDKCRVKKRVERLADDPRMVITSYEGRHVHSPSHDNLDDDTQRPSQLANFFC